MAETLAVVASDYGSYVVHVYLLHGKLTDYGDPNLMEKY